MFQVSRRDLVLAGAGAGLVFGLKGPVSFIGAAAARRSCACGRPPHNDVLVVGKDKRRLLRASRARVSLVNRAPIATIAAMATHEEGQKIVWTTDT